MQFTYDYYKVSADYIKRVSGNFEPEIGIILGSGLGDFDKEIEDPVVIPYKDIPNFLQSSAPGHSGKMFLGTVAGKKVVCMSGRFHSYEGYSYEELTIPVRVLKLLGIKKLVLTNAAGAINPDYKVGDIMIFTDHIKMFSDSPLRGKNIEEFGPRFFDCSNIYDKDLRKVALDCARFTEQNVHEGVYFFSPGPNFETPAEIRAERLLGGDCAGMSTVTESLTAAHCGLPVLAMSLCTNLAAGVSEIPLSSEDVNEAAEKVGPMFRKYFIEVLRRI